MNVVLQAAGVFGQALWTTLAEMAPYLLFGFLVAGVLSVLIRPETVERHLGGRGFWPVFKAAAVGVPLPLCSCGVIPVAASLRRHGAGKGAVVSFLLSTPQTGVDSILVTWSLLGPVFAVLRPFIALVTGLLGGWLVDRFDADERQTDDAAHPPACTDECCQPSAARRSRWLEALRYGFLVLPRDLAKPLFLGLVVSGLIGALVPPDSFLRSIGQGLPGLLLMMAVGIPLYVCATASVPIAASLIDKGVSPGAALAFLMSGPATNSATIAVVWKLLGRKTALIYLGVVAGASLLFGFLLDAVVVRTGTGIGHVAHAGPLSPLQILSALALVAVLVTARARRPALLPTETDKGGAATTLLVTGMTCDHCKDAVRRALQACPGVREVEVDLAHGVARIRGEGYSIPALVQAVENAGYHATQL